MTSDSSSQTVKHEACIHYYKKDGTCNEYEEILRENCPDFMSETETITVTFTRREAKELSLWAWYLEGGYNGKHYDEFYKAYSKLQSASTDPNPNKYNSSNTKRKKNE